MATLLVTLGIPHPMRSGRQIRDYHVVRELSRDGKVHVMSLLMEDDATDEGPIRGISTFETFRIESGPAHVIRSMANLGIPFATRTFYSSAVARRIGQVARAEGIDLVQLEHSFLACYRYAIPSTCKAVLSLHNVGSVQYRRMASTSARSARLGMSLKAMVMNTGWESQAAQRFDAVVTVSSSDRALLESHGVAPHRITVVENGVDCERLRPLPTARERATLIFTGAMSYAPNADAVLEFVARALPLIHRRAPDTRLLIVGQGPDARVRALARRERVEVTGEVPDTVPFYQRASISVVPLRAGGGTRLKILESMALGRPVVSTSIGCEGLSVEHERELLVADGASGFADAVVRMMEDDALAARLSVRARQLVEERYDWRTSVAPLRALHRKVVS